ncbi:hypothetical protein LTR84_000591 [Exophiala bonariae]|uniref:Protein kinase domain-containing protein n=1 Tax=Exophiala bonariae TaxID=1690606 RepID=A0AAV9NTS0_9EURO|nr:hypothetical protein LTR84_000591 [Exophiala bonariae]
MALAAVSLTFQLFAGCVKGYQLLSEAANLPGEYQYIRLRLEIEQARLLDWGFFVEVSEDEGSLSIGRASEKVLLEVLKQQYDLLLKFGRYDEQLAAVSKPSLVELEEQVEHVSEEAKDHDPSRQKHFSHSHFLMRRALSYIDDTRKFPRRLRWVICDKDKLDRLLCKLAFLNDFLMELLDRRQLGRLLDLQTRTNYGIMQLSSSMGQLFSLFQAETLQDPPSPLGAEDSSNHLITASQTRSSPDTRDGAGVVSLRSTFASLARTKAFNLAVENGQLTESFAKGLGLRDIASDIASAELSQGHFELHDPGLSADCGFEDPRTEATFYRGGVRTEPKHVWIEWRLQSRQQPSTTTSNGYYRHSMPGPPKGGLEMTTHNRMTALVAMLRQSKSSELFRAASCLGFFYDRTVVKSSDASPRRCGIVFEKPRNCNPSLPPVSLLEFLRRNQRGDRTLCTPSLTQRVRLAVAVAEHIERLHAVNWLHKALRSYNILFFATDEKVRADVDHPWDQCYHVFDLDKPFLSGFDLARPLDQHELSAAGPENPAHDIYRHPEIQAASASACIGMFRKSYDYYSLGIVLLEIIYWKPIDALLELRLESCQLKDTYPVRSLLLQQRQILNNVLTNAGQLMYDAVKTCLIGRQAFGLNEMDDESDPVIAARLQTEFYHQVVAKLKEIRV